MEYYAVVGMTFMAFIALFGLFINIKKGLADERKPLNDLNITMTKLNENIKHILENDVTRDNRLNKHSEEIDAIVSRQKENEKKLEIHEVRIRNLEKR